MAKDQIIELLELLKEDPAWLAEFYSVVANSELIMPMVLYSTRNAPTPIIMDLHTEYTVVFNNVRNEYEPRIPGDPFCLVYSNHDIYNNIKPSLESKIQNRGQLVDPVVKNGRQIINMCCRQKRCAAINLYADEVFQYQLTFEQMETIRQRPVIAKPKAEPEKEQNPDLEKVEKDVQELQIHISEVARENAELKARLKENAELQARLNDYEKLISEDYSVPATVWEAVENAARRHASRLIIHPKVREIVEAWPYKKKSKCVAHTVKMLEAVARTLYRMKFESPDGYIDPLEFQAITGYELAMTEGKLTKRNQSLDALRYCRYEDRSVLIYAHLKKRIDKSLHMRIYIGFLEEERRILIGQVGPHMPNSQTAGL